MGWMLKSYRMENKLWDGDNKLWDGDNKLWDGEQVIG